MIDLSSLSVGSMVEGGAPLIPLDPNEKLCLLATKVTAGETPTVEFNLTLFGVHLGTVKATSVEAATVWESNYE